MRVPRIPMMMLYLPSFWTKLVDLSTAVPEAGNQSAPTADDLLKLIESLRAAAEATVAAAGAVSRLPVLHNSASDSNRGTMVPHSGFTEQHFGDEPISNMPRPLATHRQHHFETFICSGGAAHVRSSNAPQSASDEKNSNTGLLPTGAQIPSGKH